MPEGEVTLARPKKALLKKGPYRALCRANELKKIHQHVDRGSFKAAMALGVKVLARSWIVRVPTGDPE